MNKKQIYLGWVNKDRGIDTEPFEIADINARSRKSENSILFLVEFFLGLNIKGEIDPIHDKIWFEYAVDRIRSYDKNGTVIIGLFDRGHKESEWEDKETIRHISHDNLTAIFCGSILFGCNYHREIFEYGKKNRWRFNNRDHDSNTWERTLHPRDIISFCSYGGTRTYRFWSSFALPILSALQIFSCFKKYKVRPTPWDAYAEWRKTGKWPERRKIVHTDGKILMAIRCLTTYHTSWWSRFTFKICYKILKWKLETDKPLEWLMFTYFKHPEHPVRQSWEGIDDIIKRNY